MIKSHAEIIGLWPSITNLATDLDEKVNTVVYWKKRNSIPADRWVQLVKAAQDRDLPVTYRLLAELINTT